MTELITAFTILFFKYAIFYILLLLTGRAFVLLIQRILFKSLNIPNKIFTISPIIVFPLIGLIFLGNLLIILNFFIPIKSFLVYVLLGLFILINFVNFKIKLINFKNIGLDSLLFYIVIPSLLIISSSTTNFHYDAGYYHLNHQNWLRESNLILGMVNIFWPFGMSSISEYIYSFLWFDSSFILLHFVTIYFIHFLFIFISYNILKNKNVNLKAASFFLLIYSFLDNFGLSGGRNGFPYIQGVGKQDIAVGVLYCFVSLIILNFIKQKSVNKLDFSLITLIVFFIFELKVSGVIIFFLYIVFCLFLLKNKTFTISSLFFAQLPTIFFGIIWTIKSYLTTGCIIFPLDFTCVNAFKWYTPGSTKAYEEISTVSSLAYMEYFRESGLTFSNWFNDFFFSATYPDLSIFYRSVYINFVIGLLVIYLIKLVFYEKEKSDTFFNSIILLYLISSFLYLLFFGPIPRYAMGTMLTFVAIFGFYSKTEKFELNKYMIYILIFISVGLIPRANSYIEFILNQTIAVSDPRLETLYEEVQIHENWIKPHKGDRCWINLRCTMHRENIIISEDSFFKVAFRIK